MLAGKNLYCLYFIHLIRGLCYHFDRRVVYLIDAQIGSYKYPRNLRTRLGCAIVKLPQVMFGCEDRLTAKQDQDKQRG
jgi:hypothetical protein